MSGSLGEREWRPQGWACPEIKREPVPQRAGFCVAFSPGEREERPRDWAVSGMKKESVPQWAGFLCSPIHLGVGETTPGLGIPRYKESRSPSGPAFVWPFRRGAGRAPPGVGGLGHEKGVGPSVGRLLCGLFTWGAGRTPPGVGGLGHEKGVGPSAGRLLCALFAWGSGKSAPGGGRSRA